MGASESRPSGAGSGPSPTSPSGESGRVQRDVCRTDTPSTSAPTTVTPPDRGVNERTSSAGHDQMIGRQTSGSEDWGIVKKLGDWGLIHRRVGADVYDDEKANDARNFNNNVIQSGPQNTVNVRFPDGLTPLTSAIRSSNMAAVDAFLEHPGIDVNLPERQQYSLYSHIEVPPIVVAARAKTIEVVRQLLDKGAHVDATDSNKETALFTACEAGDHQLVSLLLNSGAKTSSDPLVYDPLHAACRGGHFTCINLLVEAGCDINPIKESLELLHPLYLAISQKHEDISLFLLERGAWFVITNSLGAATPFTTACSYRCPKVVQFLIRTGSDVNQKTATGCSVLVQALQMGDLQTVAREMRVSPPDSFLHLEEKYRTILSESSQVVRMLCDANCNIAAVYGVLRLSPLCLALKSGNIPAVILLLKHGAQWTAECDSMFNKYDLRRVQQVYPDLFRGVLSFLDCRRSQIYAKYSKVKDTPSLKSCCRGVIRHRISRNRELTTTMIPSIQGLSLPHLLKEYLCFCDVNEQMYVDNMPLALAKLSL